MAHERNSARCVARVTVPLRPGDGNAWIDLRAIIDRVYDESGCEDFIYQREPEPPLSALDDAWASLYVPPPAVES
jgi:hypothetical protein